MKLSKWCKAVKIELIQRDMKNKDLANAIGMSREYVNAVINGRIRSASAKKVISDYLNIQNVDDDPDE